MGGRGSPTLAQATEKRSGTRWASGKRPVSFLRKEVGSYCIGSLIQFSFNRNESQYSTSERCKSEASGTGSNSDDMPETTDFIIVGSGISGLRATIAAEPFGEVTVLTKSRADESNTEYAQGGIAVAMNDEDEIGLHRKDTILAGDGLCDEASVQVLVEEGPQRIQELIDWGTEFDRVGTKLAFTREAAHSRRRILHAGGDSTGREINRALIQKAHSLEKIRLLPHAFAVDLVMQDGKCIGVRYLDSAAGTVREIHAGAILLATGGCGVLYRETTNPDIATGDGFALAFLAGAVLSDMEFVQFHPTALNVAGIPHFLLSEALRGEGARLKNGAGECFMERYHPAGDLAPRDVVSRSIFLETRKQGSQRVFLDLTHLDADFVRSRFPRIYSTCLDFGIDVTAGPVPVFPAAHYMMGGVYTDLEGRTTLPGLFAAGEVACNGVHGANRLASNSLLDGLVFGARAGQAMVQGWGRFACKLGQPVETGPWEMRENPTMPSKREIRELMSDNVGMAREAEGLRRVILRLEQMSMPSKLEQRVRERGNLLVNARVVSAAALFRSESRGSHYRLDYPNKANRWKRHTLIRFDAASGRASYFLAENLNRFED